MAAAAAAARAAAKKRMSALNTDLGVTSGIKSLKGSMNKMTQATGGDVDVATPAAAERYGRRASFGIDLELYDRSPLLKSYILRARRMQVLVESDTFNLILISVICFAGLLIGVQTYYPDPPPYWLALLDDIVLIVFIVEVFFKIIAEGTRPTRYWTGPEWRWNNFDFTIVFMCLWGIRDLFGSGSSLALLRLARLMRVLKLVKKIPELHMIVMGLIGGFKSIAYILLLLFLIFYLYAIVGIMLFKANDPWHFGTLEMALLSLFRMATLEDWTDVMYINYYGCSQMGDFYGQYTSNMAEALSNKEVDYCSESPKATLSAIYAITFVLISALVMMSLFVGAITMSMGEALAGMAEQRKVTEAEARKQKQLKKQLRQASVRASLKGNEGDDMEMAIRTAGLTDAWQGVASASKEAPPRTALGRCYLSLAVKCKWVAENKHFNNFITFIILLAGVLVGIQTNMGDESTTFLDVMDWIIWFIFFYECLVKFIGTAFKPALFFYDVDNGGLQGWNNFDLLIVAMSFPLAGVGSMVMILRLLRLLRVLKVLKAFPQLQVIVQALFKGMKSIGFIGIMLVVVYYVFAITGILLYKDNDPWHFGTLHDALITLFRVATGEDWTDVMYINMFGCDVYGYADNGMRPKCDTDKSMAWQAMSTFYFIVFVVIGSLIMLTLFIGVVTTSMDEATKQMSDENKVAARVKKVVDHCALDKSTELTYRAVWKLLDLEEQGAIDEEQLKLGLSTAGYKVSPKAKTENDEKLLGIVRDVLGAGGLSFDEMQLTMPHWILVMEQIKKRGTITMKPNAPEAWPAPAPAAQSTPGELAAADA